MKNTHPILWLTGNSGAGKTTLAFAMRQYFNEEVDLSHPLRRKVIVLDGDEMRKTISCEEGFSPEDRRKHNMRVARLAALFQQSGYLVIVAVIAPFTSVREELDVLCNPQWIYVKRSGLEASDRPYEPPESTVLLIDNDLLGIKEAQEKFLHYIETHIAVTTKM